MPDSKPNGMHIDPDWPSKNRPKWAFQDHMLCYALRNRTQNTRSSTQMNHTAQIIPAAQVNNTADEPSPWQGIILLISSSSSRRRRNGDEICRWVIQTNKGRTVRATSGTSANISATRHPTSRLPSTTPTAVVYSCARGCPSPWVQWRKAAAVSRQSLISFHARLVSACFFGLRLPVSRNFA